MLVLLAVLAVSVLPAQPSEGDTIVAFEVATAGSADTDIHAQRLSRDGTPVWGGGKPLAALAGTDAESAPVVCDDEAGGVIVVYEYRFLSGSNVGDTDIVAQRLAPDGKSMWGDKPIPIASSKGAETRPQVIRDGYGGAIVVYEWRDEKGDSDLLAQRISAVGKLMWGKDGKPLVLASSPSPERGASIVSDGSGGVIALFEWVGADGDIDVMAQRVSGEGAVLWETDDKARDVAATKHLERHVTAVGDGSGGALAVYELEFTSGNDKGDIDIMAQRIGPDGKLLWDKDGMVVSSGTGFERNPVACSDGSGGIIAACDYEPREGENKGDSDVIAQRLGPDGKMLWNDGKRSVVVSSSRNMEQAPVIVSDGRGGAIVACELKFASGDRKGDCDIVAQRLGPDGKMLWNEGSRSAGVATSKWLERRPVLLADGQGGAVILITQESVSGEFAGDSDVAAMRVSPAGVLDWLRKNAAVDVGASRSVERRPAGVVLGAWRPSP